MTPFWRSLEEDVFGPNSAPDLNPIYCPLMHSPKPAAPAHGRIVEQFPTFAAIGVGGFLVDAGVTYVGAKYAGLSPELARPPGFIIATIVNFALNRWITFRHARSRLIRSFIRYLLVASAGFAVNYAVYSACVFLAPRVGIAVTPAILPLFIAAGGGVAMILTFVGFRLFAFRL
jgi:putative flippase GtrA